MLVEIGGRQRADVQFEALLARHGSVVEHAIRRANELSMLVVKVEPGKVSSATFLVAGG